MKKLTIEDIDVNGKRVLLRVDFNVPLSADKLVEDETRIVAAIPTIDYLLKKGAKVIILSHLGRPKGQQDEKYSLRPVVEVLSRVLDSQVYFCPTVLGPIAQSAINCLNDGDCLLMENIRFYPEEEKNDIQFSKELASLADIYVNDAFGTAHRAHASTAGVAGYFEKAACGFLMKKELEYFDTILESPKSPFVAILGGAKVSDKIHVITSLLNIADDIIIGGGMAYSFLAAQGKSIGKSILDKDSEALVTEAFNLAERTGKRIHLPVDHVIANEMSETVSTRIVEDQIPDGFMGLDIGPKTIARFSEIISKAKMVFWNGPMGVFEMSPFQKGTFEIAKAMAKVDGITVVGGGDSVAAVNKARLAKQMSHVSTGGGASLEYMEKRPLPGVEALTDKGGNAT